MSNLKELTWEHHKNAERQEFVKELMSGNISKKRYATLLFNLHPQYNILEVTAKLYDLLDIRRAPAIHADYTELWNETEQYQPALMPVVKEYMVEKQIYMVIDKKELILADEKLDITKDIISRLNAKIKTLKLE